MSIDLNQYSNFVQAVTSSESTNLELFISRLEQLSTNSLDVNVPLLVTSGIGLSSECGEFNEIIKKMLFQQKPLTEENRYHMMRELGDIAWYWVNACRAIGYDPNDVIDENVRKLEARYPGGKFDAHYSENRKDNDI